MAKPPPGSVEIEDGVHKLVLQDGDGDPPKQGQKIEVHCTGSLAGPPVKKFWSTKDPGQQPFAFNVGLGQVIAGWDAGCMTMSVGEKALLTIRGDKGYGAKGFPAWGITPNATLQFEIEVLSIK
eukprot:m.479053 g.479053  ORF g.479053 m.479053 type:complete len:124 (-) comp21308_c0_seq1:28-399(-)